jgi:hypothetical protein
MGMKNDGSGASEEAAAVASMIARGGAAELAGWMEKGWARWLAGELGARMEARIVLTARASVV